MTDNRIEKVRAEIERRIALYSGLSEETVNPNRIDEDRQILSFIDSLQEEPTSDELEEVAENYAATDEVLPNGKVMINFQAEKAFRDGAKWQKEQMMKKAFSVEIGKQRTDYKCVLNGNFFKYDTGDKVKVIVIKED